MMAYRRISGRELDRIQQRLSTRDSAILGVVAEHRYLTTKQISRFIFVDKPTETAALRAANRTLSKLADLLILQSLQRRIGGVRAGSGGYVWHLTDAGARLLRKETGTEGGNTSRQRSIEPSSTFLEHTLAIAEVHLHLRQATSEANITLRPPQLEPDCWRAYVGSGGGTLRLKPDLAITTLTGDYEDHWFIEVDRDTEPPSRIIRKCLQYQEYQRTGTEQHRIGVFPAVVWIVPGTIRREQLQRRLSAEPAISKRLFTVVTLDHLASLISEGANHINPTGGQQGEHPHE